MKKILVGFIMNGRAGGIDKYLLNFLNTVWDKDVQIDFLTNEIEEELKFQLSCFNSKLFSISSLRQPVRQYRQIVHLLEQGDYDTVYFNISTAIDCIAALAAKRCNVKKRIIHSHSSGNDCENWKKRKVFDFIHGICRLFLYKMGTHFYGCSKKAGLWMFPKRIVESSRFEVIYNAVDIEKFNFSSYERAKIRKDLNVEDRFVIGHVGNFCYAKNYPFLIQVFREVWKLDSRAILLLAGEGAQYEAVRQLT